MYPDSFFWVGCNLLRGNRIQAIACDYLPAAATLPTPLPQKA